MRPVYIHTYSDTRTHTYIQTQGHTQACTNAAGHIRKPCGMLLREVPLARTFRFSPSGRPAGQLDCLSGWREMATPKSCPRYAHTTGRATDARAYVRTYCGGRTDGPSNSTRAYGRRRGTILGPARRKGETKEGTPLRKRRRKVNDNGRPRRRPRPPPQPPNSSTTTQMSSKAAATPQMARISPEHGLRSVSLVVRRNFPEKRSPVRLFAHLRSRTNRAELKFA